MAADEAGTAGDNDNRPSLIPLLRGKIALAAINISYLRHILNILIY
jgi:hypothetical protein